MNMQKSRIEISKGALYKNIASFKRLMKRNVKFCAVIKANAYGHGMNEVADLIKDKVDFFAVDNADDALSLRKSGIKIPILVMGYIPVHEIGKIIENDISFVAYRKKFLEKIVSLNPKSKAKIHIKIETGLNRQGIKSGELESLLKFILKYKEQIRVEGAYTHFANIEDTLEPGFAFMQMENFKKELNTIYKRGIKPNLIHASASAGTILYPEFNFDMVRVGIGLYGYWPSQETAVSALVKKMKVKLNPVLTWKSVVAQIKVVNKGESVGYGRTWYALKNTRIAVIPVGYSDGYDRGLSGLGKVFIKNKPCPVIGRIAMNMFMADITAAKGVKEEDEVVILDRRFSADEAAALLGTINYEIISRISPLLPRVVTK